MSSAARALIKLGAIKHNYRLLKERSNGSCLMAVVKANAYGHGLLPVARCLDEADCFAVARIAEAELLRSDGIATPIALLGGVLGEDDVKKAVDLDLQVAIHSYEQVAWLERCKTVPEIIWVKVDTGMNRLGFRPHEVTDALARLERLDSVRELRLMTHLASAEDVEEPATELQLEKFASIVDGFEGDISIANSAAIFAWQDRLGALFAPSEGRRLWARAGLALYGISPFPDKSGADLGLQPAMRFESKLVAVKALGKGQAVGYGGAWHADRDTVLGIAGAGYGDGYTRYIPTGSPIVVNGRPVRVAGRVSMDLTAVDLGPDAKDRVGDPVLLWGDELPVEEVAIHADTIPYQLVCGVSERVSYEFV
ncbi:MAG: alanine racemase [Woeseiaceae bacterium]|nr:alanine racemase [Woeseiaceae bacterium]